MFYLKVPRRLPPRFPIPARATCSRLVFWVCSLEWAARPWRSGSVRQLSHPVSLFARTMIVIRVSGGWLKGAVACAMQGQAISTVFGWHVRAGADQRWRSYLNFPMQANGAEMMRLACCMAIEVGIEVCAPVHDAFLICAPLDQIDARVEQMKFIMEEASRIVLDGFTVKADCPEFDENGKLLKFPQIVRYPNRYMIKRGEGMWNKVMKILERFKEDRGEEVA